MRLESVPLLVGMDGVIHQVKRVRALPVLLPRLVMIDEDAFLLCRNVARRGGNPACVDIPPDSPYTPGNFCRRSVFRQGSEPMKWS